MENHILMDNLIIQNKAAKILPDRSINSTTSLALWNLKWTETVITIESFTTVAFTVSFYEFK